VDSKSGVFYIIDQTYLSVLNMKREKLSSWKLPDKDGLGLKIDQDRVYFTLSCRHQIFVYSLTGTKIKTLGSEDADYGGKKGKFNRPYGLNIEKNDLYVADFGNDRVQVVNKESGEFDREWGGVYGTEEGQFCSPHSIYLFSEEGKEKEERESMVYVGDEVSVQLFTTQGTFLQRIGEKEKGKKNTQFQNVWGVCVGDDGRLYVCDSDNSRIQVFRKRE